MLPFTHTSRSFIYAIALLVACTGALLVHALRSNKELPLYISVCAYNDARWVVKNLDSIFRQKYSNFHVVYIDDASTDGTSHLVRHYIDTHKLHDKITLIVNPVRCRKMQNIYNAFHDCPDESIIVQIDADDWLPDDQQVFARINNIYQNKDVWLTYGQFRGYPNNRTGPREGLPTHVVANRTFRDWGWEYLHLRTFKAWLFKNIKLEDFVSELTPGFEGKFFPVQNDSASYYPMLEMAGNRIEFIPDITYIYNETNPLCGVRVDFKLHERTGIDIKKNRKKYAKLDKPIYNRLAKFENAQADLVVLSDNQNKNIEALMNSLHKLQGIKNIYVVYDEVHKTLYDQLQSAYSHIRFIPVKNTAICSTLYKLLQNSEQEHIVLSTDAVIVQDPIDVHACILELEKTFAHGFYLGFAHNGSPFYNESTGESLLDQHVHDDIYTWKFNCSYDNLCNNIDMTLLRKKSVLDAIERMSKTSSIDTVTSFLIAWQEKEHPNMQNVGLFFSNLKVNGLRTQPKQTLLAYNARGKGLVA